MKTLSKFIEPPPPRASLLESIASVQADVARGSAPGIAPTALPGSTAAKGAARSRKPPAASPDAARAAPSSSSAAVAASSAPAPSVRPASPAAPVPAARLSGSFAALARAHERFGRRDASSTGAEEPASPPAPIQHGSVYAAARASAQVFAEVNQETKVQQVMMLVHTFADYYELTPEERAIERARLLTLDDAGLDAARRAYEVASGQALVMVDEGAAQRAALEVNPKVAAFYHLHEFRERPVDAEEATKQPTAPAFAGSPRDPLAQAQDRGSRDMPTDDEINAFLEEAQDEESPRRRLRP